MIYLTKELCEQALLGGLLLGGGGGGTLTAGREALEETLETGFGTYFSRSRQKLWRKGEQSGNRQKVFEVLLDCDGDSVIYKVEQKGNIACHTGHRSCFYRSWDGKDWKENAPVLKSPEEMYGKEHH